MITKHDINNALLQTPLGQNAEKLDTTTMRNIVADNLPACFETVLACFQQSTHYGDVALLQASQKHIQLFIKLCEWGEGKNALNSYGVTNRMVKPKSYSSQGVEKLCLSKQALQSVEIGAETAVMTYAQCIRALQNVLDISAGCDVDSVDFAGSAKTITAHIKTCLGALAHITELCKIAEYATRAETIDEAITCGENGANAESEDPFTAYFAPHAHITEEMAWEMFEGLTAKQAYDVLCEKPSHVLSEVLVKKYSNKQLQ